MTSYSLDTIWISWKICFISLRSTGSFVSQSVYIRLNTCLNTWNVVDENKQHANVTSVNNNTIYILSAFVSHIWYHSCFFYIPDLYLECSHYLKWILDMCDQNVQMKPTVNWLNARTPKVPLNFFFIIILEFCHFTSTWFPKAYYNGATNAISNFFSLELAACTKNEMSVSVSCDCNRVTPPIYAWKTVKHIKITWNYMTNI